MPAPPRALGDLGRVGALGQRDREGRAARPALSRGQLAGRAGADRRHRGRRAARRAAPRSGRAPRRRRRAPAHSVVAASRAVATQRRALVGVERGRPRDHPEEAEQRAVVAHRRAGPRAHPDRRVGRRVDHVAGALQAERVEPRDDLGRRRASEDRRLADAILQLGVGAEGQQAPAAVLERDRTAERRRRDRPRDPAARRPSQPTIRPATAVAAAGAQSRRARAAGSRARGEHRNHADGRRSDARPRAGDHRDRP